ncbi:MAG: hypothetical protein LIP77_12330 [Planctomycetes bacterium]|nr:hypothetical protein [Planctomycetota bacterium]
MSISYWVAKKFGMLIVLFYVVVMGVLVVSYYHESGIASPQTLAAFYPPGRTYTRTTKNATIREILGFPASEAEEDSGGTVAIVSYTGDGAVIRSGKTQESVATHRVIRSLGSRDSRELEAALAPLYGPFDALLRLHLSFMRRVEDAVGGEAGGLQKMILPKVVISLAYLGLVFLVLSILKRVDNAAEGYRGGYSLIYGSFLYWPIAVIAISFIGTNVVDVVRHLPDSLEFMHWYVAWGWIAMLAWPLLVALFSLLDILRSALHFDYNRTIAHALVLTAGRLSIPLVTVGVMFAVMVVVMYVGYRVTRRVLLPEKVKSILSQ